MTTDSLLCGIDGSPESHAAAGVASRLAARLGARLVLAHVAPDPEVMTRPYSSQAERARRQASFDRAGHERVMLGAVPLPEPVAVERIVEFGETPDVLRELAEREGAALIVVGSRGLGPVADAILGSVSGALAADAPVPVVIVSGRAATALGGSQGRRKETIVAGLDGSAYARAAARVAADLAARLDWSLTLAHVTRPGEEDEDVDPGQLAASVLDVLGPRAPEVHIVNAFGTVHQELAVLGRTHKAALLAVGSRGRGPLKASLLGSVSRKLVQVADRPVMVVSPRAAAATPDEASDARTRVPTAERT